MPASKPFDSPHLQRVQSFQELCDFPLADGINAVCWERTLPGDFAEVVEQLGSALGRTLLTLEPAMLRALPLSPAGRLAVECMLTDLRLLSERELAPVLNCVYAYARDERPGPLATDVFSFHVDSAPCPTETWLCTYHGPASEGLGNDHAQRHVDIPATRATLLAAYGGSDDAGFATFLSDNAYDLHYAALPQARAFSFGLGNLWRIATTYPGGAVPPCIHRAPPTMPGDPPRLLLIS
jgi:hypothetical protein